MLVAGAVGSGSVAILVHQKSWTPSAWEGFDISQRIGPNGEKLDNAIKHVIVTQLPYAPPDGAIDAALRQYLLSPNRARPISADKIDGLLFVNQLGAMLRKLRQAFGRGIRSAKDEFTFWVTDPRFPRSRRVNAAFPVASVRVMERAKYAIPERFRRSVDEDSAWDLGSVLGLDGRVISAEEMDGSSLLDVV